jgi:competence protein ComFA
LANKTGLFDFNFIFASLGDGEVIIEHNIHSFAYILSENEKVVGLTVESIFPGGQAVVAGSTMRGAIPAISHTHGASNCQRCGAQWTRGENQLPLGGEFCPECIGLGRITSRDDLYREPMTEFMVRAAADICAWSGTLTPAQAGASQDIIQTINRQRPLLVWAVTGAGKTEMTFPAVAAVLASGGMVGYASPRIDVCNELFPRLQRAFPTVASTLLHGQQTQSYAGEQLVVCTVHQLLRFYHAFQLLIVDEVDAFPMVNSRLLHAAVRSALLPTGAKVYLSATPDRKLLYQARHGEIDVTYLARRFHGYPLPVPRCHWCRQTTLTTSLRPLLAVVGQYRQQFVPVMIFVPTVPLLTTIVERIHHRWPQIKVAGVHANDSHRIEKIQAFRQGQTTVLVTTTILERGVTIGGLQVIVWQACHQHFQANALVQVAGRAGRADWQPDGNVDFFYHRYTLAIAEAIRQIKKMNRRGGF